MIFYDSELNKLSICLTGKHSALNIILEGKKKEHLQMLKGGVIQKLLEEKWKSFGHVIIVPILIFTNFLFYRIYF